MSNTIEILGYTAIGAIITLIIREIFAWKFAELERRRIGHQRIIEKVYGPIRVVTWRMDLDAKTTHKYWITSDEYMELRRIAYLFSFHILDPNYRKLLDNILDQIMKDDQSMTRFRQDGKYQLAIDTPKITEFINQTEFLYEFLSTNLQDLNTMRSGFLKNIKFIFLV